MYFSQKDIQDLPKIKRLNLINSVTGIKPGNLIGTRSNNGNANLAVISSVVHLGSNPAYVGFILRPSTSVPRHTRENIMENKCFTINNIPALLSQQAHYTSAKFDKDKSEFEACNFGEEYLDDFSAPYVKESKLKLGLEWVESIPISINKTEMIVGQIKHVYVQEDAISKEGYINLEKLNTLGIGGLNAYYKVEKIAEYPYARVNELPNFKYEKK